MYIYESQRKNIFTEQGQEMFIKIRDKAKSLLATAGSFRMDAIMSSCTGDTWDMLACVDRMVEMGELKEITPENVSGQHRVFVSLNH